MNQTLECDWEIETKWKHPHWRAVATVVTKLALSLVGNDRWTASVVSQSALEVDEKRCVNALESERDEVNHQISSALKAHNGLDGIVELVLRGSVCKGGDVVLKRGQGLASLTHMSLHHIGIGPELGAAPR